MTTTTTTLDLDAIKARADAATPGPWQMDGPHWWGEDDCTDVVSAHPNRDAVALMPRERECDPAQRTPNARFIAHAREDIPALVAELKQSRRGGKKLGKSIVALMELIKDAYLRSADDPIDALHMLGNCLAEVFEGEGGLPADDFSRVYRALEDRRTKLAKDHDELRDKGTDLLNIRGILSPQCRSLGLGPVVPMPLGKEVSPAVEWLANEADRLREENAQLRAELSRPLTDNERAFQDGV